MIALGHVSLIGGRSLLRQGKVVDVVLAVILRNQIFDCNSP